MFHFKKLRSSSTWNTNKAVFDLEKKKSCLLFTKQLMSPSIYDKKLRSSSNTKINWGHLPFPKQFMLSSIYKKNEVVFQLQKKIEVVFHLKKIIWGRLLFTKINLGRLPFTKQFMSSSIYIKSRLSSIYTKK